MRARPRAAHGAALLYVLAAVPAFACPVASDLSGAGIRFVGADGADEVHRALDGATVQIDYIPTGEPTLSRSALVHGVFILYYGDVGPDGEIVPETRATFTRPGKAEDLPRPVAGLTWTGAHTFTDAGGPVEEGTVLTVGQPAPVTLGTCTYTGIRSEMVTHENGTFAYSESTIYFPDLGTALFVAYTDPDGTSDINYVDIRVEGS